MSLRPLRDRYQVLEEVGRGGQGQVFRGRDLLHDRQVALKVRTVGAGVAAESVFAEGRILFSLTPHPHLAVLREDAVIDESYVLVMDWVDGPNLEEHVGRTGRLPYLEAVQVLGTIGAVLDHLHQHDPPVVHADVKPANVILSADRGPVLVDLGVAGADAVYGTRDYRAPEQSSGEATQAADVYGLAATAHTLLEGRAPDPTREPSLETVPAALRVRVLEGLRRGLAFDPGRRPRSAGELVALLSPVQTPTNLPASLSSFVGRASELRSITASLDTVRLLTLGGPAGVGKTRLAREVAGDRLHAYPDGVWWVEFGTLLDPRMVPEAVATAVGGSGPEPDPVRRATAAVSDGHVLVVLDNAEHVLEQAGRTADALLRACPNLTIVVTSREPLGLLGEQVWDVPPLSVPEERQGTWRAVESEAVRLFCERAKPMEPEEEDWPTLVSLCRALDGLPLAIEMAAARARTMSLGELESGLRRRFELLVAGPATLPRHRSLHAALTWSHDLLDDRSRTCFRRLSVFPADFDVEAATAACTDDEIGADEVAPILRGLVERSLIQSSEGRFTALATVRDFAGESLAEHPEDQEATRDRILEWVTALSTQAQAALVEPDPSEWLTRIDGELPTVLLALDRCRGRDDARALAILNAFARYWLYRSPSEGRRRVTEILEAGPDVDALHLIAGWELAGAMANAQGDVAEARRAFETSARLSRETGQERQLARSLSNLGAVASRMGDQAAVRAYLEEAAVLARQVDDEQLLFATLSNLGAAAAERGDHEEAEELIREALALERGSFPAGRSLLLNNLAIGYRVEGRLDEARAALLESLDLKRQAGNRAGEAHTLTILGDVERLLGRLDEADRHLHEALDHAAVLDLGPETQAALECLGVLEAERCEHERAVQLLAAADALQRASELAPDSVFEDQFRRTVASLRQTVPADAFDRLWDLGARLTRDEAVALARAGGSRLPN